MINKITEIQTALKKNDRQKEANKKDRKIEQDKINATTKLIHPDLFNHRVHWQSIQNILPINHQTHPHDHDDRLPA